MKPYYEFLKDFEFQKPISELTYRIKSLLRYNIDMDVFLPTKGRNLQRGFVWSLEQKRELILSIFLRKHIPHIATIDISKGTATHIQVIDGKQRVSTIIAFAKDEFTIPFEGEEYLFSQLPEDYRIAFLSSYLRTYVMNEHYDNEITDDEKIRWFKFLNFAGTPQDKEYLELLDK
jgi:uncharacterized protein with ParB-like and HNH nuclease domain